MLDVNKNAIAQVNYGTGGDVSDESIADADGPLRVRWHTDSYVTVPFNPEAFPGTSLPTLPAGASGFIPIACCA